MPTWLGRSTTAISLFAWLAAGLIGPAAATEESVERVVETARKVSLTPERLPTSAEASEACGADTVCVARMIAKAVGPSAYLEKIGHPQTDSIRRATTETSVVSVSREKNGVRRLELTRFGRKAETEVISAAVNGPLILDLRCNSGGDLDRMLRVAAIFTGPINNAVSLETNSGRETLPVPTPATRFHAYPLTVLIDKRTASSAEVLAALLQRHARADLLGERTYGKTYVSSVVPVSNDLQLILPSGLISVPGVPLTGGLAPDGPWEGTDARCFGLR